MSNQADGPKQLTYEVVFDPASSETVEERSFLATTLFAASDNAVEQLVSLHRYQQYGYFESEDPGQVSQDMTDLSFILEAYFSIGTRLKDAPDQESVHMTFTELILSAEALRLQSGEPSLIGKRPLWQSREFDALPDKHTVERSSRLARRLLELCAPEQIADLATRFRLPLFADESVTVNPE